MPFSPPQQIRASVLRIAAVAAVALGLAGCVRTAGTETTGSLSASAARPTSEAALRQASVELGRRYDGNPGERRVSLDYAQTLRGLGQRAQAVAVLQQAAIKSPRDLTVLAAYGKALADAGRLKEAADILRRAHHPERPDWRILSVQGVIADQLGDFEGAQRYYLTALQIVPGEPSVLSNQGLSYALSRRLSEAEAILRIAASDRRAEGRVRQNLALVLGLQGKFAEAESVLKQDMAPAEAAQTLASIKRMVAQPNSWKAMRQQAGAKPSGQSGPNGWPDPGSARSGRDGEPNTRGALHRLDHGEQILRGRIAGRTEHPHQALRRCPGLVREALESNRRVDEVPQDRLAGLDVSAEEVVHRLAEKRLAEGLIAIGAGLHRVPERA